MEIFRALGVLIEPPDEAHRADHLRLARLLDLADSAADLPPADAYSELFLFQLYPYASVYTGAEGMLGGEARDRIAGFLRALGAATPSEPDHLSFLLAAYADLSSADDDRVDGDRVDGGVDPRPRSARTALLWEHLLSWLPAWLYALHRLRPPMFYARWADLLDEALQREAALLGPAAELPLHLRAAPPLADPDAEGAAAFLDSLLAPVRSGIVLVRDDLRRAAGQLRLGLRAGERRYVLEQLLAQDPSAMLGWLIGEADRWAEFWGRQTWLGPVATAWATQAAATAATLRSASPQGAPTAES